MLEKERLPTGTKVYLSEKGYYGYHYVNTNSWFVLADDIHGKALYWASGVGRNWQAYLVSYKLLKSFCNRSCNVIWIKK